MYQQIHRVRVRTEKIFSLFTLSSTCKNRIMNSASILEKFPVYLSTNFIICGNCKTLSVLNGPTTEGALSGSGGTPYLNDLARSSYFMATQSLHLTTFCLQYKPNIVSAVCIHIACKWTSFEVCVFAWHVFVYIYCFYSVMHYFNIYVFLQSVFRS